MLDVPGFRDLAEVHRSTATIVLRAVRERDGLPVILNHAAGERPSRRDQAALLTELGLLAELSCPHVIGVHGIVRARDRLVLVTEHFDGVPLERYFAATEATEVESLMLFSAALAEHTGAEVPHRFASWDEAVRQLFALSA